MKKFSFWQKFRYRFDNLMSKGTTSLLMLLGVITAVVVIAGGLIAVALGGKHIDSIYSVRTRKSFCLKSVDRHWGPDCRCCGFLYDPLYERSLAGLSGSAQDNMRFLYGGFAFHYSVFLLYAII